MLQKGKDTSIRPSSFAGPTMLVCKARQQRGLQFRRSGPETVAPGLIPPQIRSVVTPRCYDRYNGCCSGGPFNPRLRLLQARGHGCCDGVPHRYDHDGCGCDRCGSALAASDTAAFVGAGAGATTNFVRVPSCASEPSARRCKVRYRMYHEVIQPRVLAATCYLILCL